MTKANAIKLALAPLLAVISLAAATETASAQYGPRPYAGGPLGGAASQPHAYFGIEGQGFFILKQITDQTGYLGQGGGANLFFGWRFGPMVSLEFNLGITYHDESFKNVRVLNSLFLLTPTVDLKFHFAPGGRLQPFVQVGAGYAYLGANYADEFGCGGGSCDTTFAQGPLFQFGGGFDYWATPFVTVGTRLLYRLARLSDRAYGGAGSSNIINGLVLGINGTYHFF